MNTMKKTSLTTHYMAEERPFFDFGETKNLKFHYKTQATFENDSLLVKNEILFFLPPAILNADNLVNIVTKIVDNPGMVNPKLELFDITVVKLKNLPV